MFDIITLIVCLVILPVVFALKSEDHKGIRKLIWAFAAFSFSWLGYFVVKLVLNNEMKNKNSL